MIASTELKAGVTYCMNYGKRMIDDSHYLWQAKRHSSAIPLYILAFEELNKATFLEEKYRIKVSVSDEEWRQLSSMGTHTTKLQHAYRSLVKESRETPLSRRQAVVNYRKIRDPTWVEPDEDKAMKGLEFLADQMPKLNEIKKEFLYVSYHNEDGWKTTGNKYGSRVLDALCFFLHHRANFQYLRLKVLMDMDDLGLYPQDLKTLDEKNRMHDHKSTKDFESASRVFQTAESRTYTRIVMQLLNKMKVPNKGQKAAKP